MAFCNLAALLDRAATIHADRTAVREAGAPWSYRALHAKTLGLAARLSAAGVQPGDRVAGLADNCAAFLCLHFAIARLGAILVPLNGRLTPPELDDVLALAGTDLVYHDAAHESLANTLANRAVTLPDLTDLPSTDEAPPCAATSSDNPAQLYFTSGSTGHPKGVVLTHGNVHAHALSSIAELGLREADVWLHAAPMFHLADAWATWAITAVGGCHAFLPRFDAETAFTAITRDRVTITNLVPTMLNRMVHVENAEACDTSSMRRVLSGGAPIAPETVRRIVAVFGCEYVQTYGMTETAPYLTFSLLDADQRALPAEQRLRIASRTGRPVLGIDLRVVDEHGSPVAADDTTVGEIQVRGPSVTPGYWNDEVTTSAAFTADGYLKTGDLATLDASGSVRIVDRSKDVILSGGETVYSTEVEHRLQEHPAVLEVAVFATPDDDLGEQVTAAVVFRDGAAATGDELRNFCRETLAGFKCPRAFRFLEALPRLGSGKISKKALRGEAV